MDAKVHGWALIISVMLGLPFSIGALTTTGTRSFIAGCIALFFAGIALAAAWHYRKAKMLAELAELNKGSLDRVMYAAVGPYPAVCTGKRHPAQSLALGDRTHCTHFSQGRMCCWCGVEPAEVSS
jgi:hypothetical protein